MGSFFYKLPLANQRNLLYFIKNELLMFRIIILLIISAFFYSCNSADDQIPEIADKYCNCFSSVERSLSKSGKKILKKASQGAEEEELDKMRENLSEEDQELLKDDYKLITSIDDEDSKVHKCITRVDNEIKELRTMDEEKYLNNLIAEMKENKNCFLGSYIFEKGKGELNAKKKKKPGKVKAEDEEEVTEEDTEQ
jgi:hypothetical protein